MHFLCLLLAQGAPGLHAAGDDSLLCMFSVCLGTICRLNSILDSGAVPLYAYTFVGRSAMAAFNSATLVRLAVGSGRQMPRGQSHGLSDFAHSVPCYVGVRVLVCGVFGWLLSFGLMPYVLSKPGPALMLTRWAFVSRGFAFKYSNRETYWTH